MNIVASNSIKLHGESNASRLHGKRQMSETWQPIPPTERVCSPAGSLHATNPRLGHKHARTRAHCLGRLHTRHERNVSFRKRVNVVSKYHMRYIVCRVEIGIERARITARTA
jgi:hypothetical protein